jgi:dihydroorotate dehydrogenase
VTAYSFLFDHGFTRVDPEKAHQLGFRAVRAARPLLARRRTPGSPVSAMGMTFPNVLGLAAGFDKNAVGIDALGALGFGHVEVGTVTGRAQPGNDKPRLFRLPADGAVVNRMGFNNEDDESAVLDDYGLSARLLAPFADYLVVNVSSPNTPGLRTLQSVEKLQPLLEHVRRTADQAVADRRVPLLVKIAPDLADEDVLAVADLATAIGLDGIIATNTTISRDGLSTPAAEVDRIGAGGLSGRPLTQRSLEVLGLLRGRVGAGLTLVGVGGITSVEDARARLDAGADLLQGYTAFVYEGPGWPRRILRGVQ